jgi:hypothetical protein
LFDQVKLFGEDVAKVLEPGERLLALGGYHELLAGDESKLALETGELSGREREVFERTGRRLEVPDRLFLGVDWRGVHINPDRLHRWWSGLSGVGAAESVAGRMWRAAKGKPGLEWAVTDRRLLLLSSDTAVDRAYAVVFDVPRAQVRSVARRGKVFFQWARVEISFVDGSMLAFNPALMDVSAARALVRALS